MPLRRQRSHFADGILQPQHALFADVDSQHSRKRAVVARMGHAFAENLNPAIGRDHRARILHHPNHIFLARSRDRPPGSRRLLDLHRGLGGVFEGRRRGRDHASPRPGFYRRDSASQPHCDELNSCGSPAPRSTSMRWATSALMRARVAGSLRRATSLSCAAFLRPRREHRARAGLRRRVGILIDGDIDAAAPGLFDQSERLGALVPSWPCR